jgi:hypothetical protein
VQDDISVARWLSVSASARADFHNQFGTFVSPRVSALFRWEGWTSRLSAGQGCAAIVLYARLPAAEKSKPHVPIAATQYDQAMEPRELVIGLVSGAAAIVFGLVPGLFSGLILGVRNFREVLLFGAAVHPHRMTEAERLRKPVGLAVVGVLIIAFTLAAYVLS